jgi:subtilisin family serine protease
MSEPRRKLLRAALALSIILVVATGSSDGSGVRRQKRVDPARLKPKRSVRVERPGHPGPLAGPSDRILVRFRSEVSPEYAEGLLGSYRFREVRKIGPIGIFAVRTPENVSVEETLAVLARNPDIERAGPDHRTRLFVTPNDTFFQRYQYNLRNRGTVLEISSEIRPQTTAGADIKATTAWDETRGDPDVLIAVLDTGVDMTHPELVDKVVSTGRDFVNDDLDATDDHWHGTHVAGVAAADTGNGEGIAGVAWDCRILPGKVIDADGSGYYSWLIDGIVWAVDEGAKVINLSLGGDEDDEFLEDACKYAYDRGVVIVAASGNDGASVGYPAAFDRYVLAVAATDYNDERASFSNFGPEVDVAAPGVYILGPCPQWYAGEGYLPYLFGSGTSQATPHVAGLAALIMSVKPWLEPDDVMDIVRYTADDVNRSQSPGRDDDLGYGRINMERALVPYVLR